MFSEEIIARNCKVVEHDIKIEDSSPIKTAKAYIANSFILFC